ncbi:Re/Si-specific NAD(P)(+) transhydrogenase subunit alpha [Asticcacaulis sp. BYS171W]|uniref:proton-translocating NAD(P)(+) transhydrogenase n=1 Tax=Asticcacaulis aquaticus TaxID=2984212 RepID=A0ABT5HTV8_9CAUL|nr:Re/Si-specific NAD(P)(+) transhydrogenase subunit alpha [Asticcacaulis aquaticus]MDC7683506.1 Re/Si-specific NAD(P)(+) transhydrogenase subunit alpha [Asticcacaulis aquaticus]
MPVTIGILKEVVAGETRVGATPDTVKKWVGAGQRVIIESGAGVAAAFTDEAYIAAGAEIVSATDAQGADIVLKVRAPQAGDIKGFKSGATVIALLDAYREKDALKALADTGVTAYAMEFVPRITRAQVMDALSSQANLAGYRAVIEAAHLYGKAFPMMMTAAGTVAPAKVFVMGVGVAGLQAIATARRLGAVVTATDVRPATKEQVESLGAKFIAVEDEEFKNAQTAGGYAKEMSAEYKAKQADLVTSHIGKQDIVITTALIPGRAAPVLVNAAQVASMKPGSVLVDLAAPQGGNVEGTLADTVVDANGVKIYGPSNIVTAIANDASALYAKNLQAFVGLLINKEGQIAPDFEDEILKAALVTQNGAVVHPNLQN